MTTVKVLNTSDAQSIRLPDGFRFDVEQVSIRRDGNAVILEPLPQDAWPEGFFEDIRIDDPAFDRPEQGATPAAPILS